MIKIEPPLSEPKMRAIRLLGYIPATKVLLHCRKRFWEAPPHRIFGGVSMTDQVIGSIYYPSDRSRRGRIVYPALPYNSPYGGLPVNDWKLSPGSTAAGPGV